MKSDLNIVQLVGTVKKEPKQDPQFNKVTFVLQNMRYKTKPEPKLVPMFINIECFREVAAQAANFVDGDRLFISGVLQITSYQPKGSQEWKNWVCVIPTVIEKLVKKDEEKEDDLFNQPQINTDEIPF